ncbi:HD family phosphohydrolase [Radiobacillus kanasensis]|uniref:HD family phosphohydrolase n=1 Tax=Radiobacillus kanasensis TaxID=2844358 RepID=UPI001E34F5D0|nr:HD family phosphohydrolase [Radiobacillus kanasensis]UFU01386.1 HD family phosphohydrolase [Radiobacillus kanasensis]
MQKKIQAILSYLNKQRNMFSIGLPILLLGVFCLLMTLSNVFTETYDMERFSTAKEAIRSPITIENVQETERRTREAVQAVEDRYDISSEITQERIQYVHELFDAIQTLEATDPESKEEIPKTVPEKAQYISQILSPELSEAVDKESIVALLGASENERSLAKELLTTSLYDVLNAGVRTENLENAVDNINQSLRYSSLKPGLKNALYDISKFAVVENSFFDVETTMEAQKQAASNVEPVMIRAGEVIVREGQTITNEIYEKLSLVGLLNNERNVFPIIGLLLLITLICATISYELHTYSKKDNLNPGRILAVVIIAVFMVTVMKVVSIYNTSMYQFFLLVPAATGAMLIKVLLNERVAIVLSSLFALMGSLIFNGEIPGAFNMEAGIYIFFSQVVGSILIRNLQDKTAILKAAIGITVVNEIVILMFLFLSFESYTIPEILIQSGFGVASAFLSVILTMGMIPYFEAGLGILSESKLLTLANPNHPLLRKILTEAPGTYHHSVMVANLSETACEAIGANGLLARVAAYYHDLGKTERPHYFIENQMGIQNPHDLLEPIQSAEIIIRHPYDGAMLLKKHKLPKEIIDIAEQHHGTTLLKYFYYKAKDKYKDIEESNYRYAGPKPQTKEAAVICICDSVEAAVRSLQEPTMKKIEEIVYSIIQDRLNDGQLNECPITINELHVIQKTICETLAGIFHSRIQYPTKQENIKEAN